MSADRCEQIICTLAIVDFGIGLCISHLFQTMRAIFYKLIFMGLAETTPLKKQLSRLCNVCYCYDMYNVILSNRIKAIFHRYGGTCSSSTRLKPCNMHLFTNTSFQFLENRKKNQSLKNIYFLSKSFDCCEEDIINDDLV